MLPRRAVRARASVVRPRERRAFDDFLAVFPPSVPVVDAGHDAREDVRALASRACCACRGLRARARARAEAVDIERAAGPREWARASECRDPGNEATNIIDRSSAVGTFGQRFFVGRLKTGPYSTTLFACDESVFSSSDRMLRAFTSGRAQTFHRARRVSSRARHGDRHRGYHDRDRCVRVARELRRDRTPRPTRRADVAPARLFESRRAPSPASTSSTSSFLSIFFSIRSTTPRARARARDASILVRRLTRRPLSPRARPRSRPGGSPPGGEGPEASQRETCVSRRLASRRVERTERLARASN